MQVPTLLTFWRKYALAPEIQPVSFAFVMVFLIH